MNKKTYQAPAVQIIELEAQLPLAGSVTGNTGNAEGQDDVIFESISKGWSSDNWSSNEE